MKAPTPTLTALAVNATVEPEELSNMVPVFQSIERAYNVDIRLTHTGVQVRARFGIGQVFFERGKWDSTKSGVAKGHEQCFMMRKYGFELLAWARENMPTDAVRAFMKGMGYEH